MTPMTAEPVPKHIDDIARAIVHAAYEIHTTLGPWLLESVYERCLMRELLLRGLRPRNQVAIAMDYKGEAIECGFRADLIVDDCVLVEIKAVETLSPVHTAQILTYLKLTGLRVGLLMNFNVSLIKNGIRRYAR